MKKTRRDAIMSGDRQYNTGRACKHGHLSPRYTINNVCLQCQAVREKVKREHITAIRQLKEKARAK